MKRSLKEYQNRVQDKDETRKIKNTNKYIKYCPSYSQFQH